MGGLLVVTALVVGELLRRGLRKHLLVIYNWFCVCVLVFAITMNLLLLIVLVTYHAHPSFGIFDKRVSVTVATS